VSTFLLLLFVIVAFIVYHAVHPRQARRVRERGFLQNYRGPDRTRRPFE
jgi:hypothetical protein